MSRVSVYRNVAGDAEEAFAFYAELFGTEPIGPISRFSDLPEGVGGPPVSEAERGR